MKNRLKARWQFLAYSLLEYFNPLQDPLQGFKTMFVLTPPGRQCCGALNVFNKATCKNNRTRKIINHLDFWIFQTETYTRL